LKIARFESELFLYQHVSNNRKEKGLKTKKLPLPFHILTFCSFAWEFPPDTLIGGLDSMFVQLRLYSLKAENLLKKNTTDSLIN
jgi:hypothetical protein